MFINGDILEETTGRTFDLQNERILKYLIIEGFVSSMESKEDSGASRFGISFIDIPMTQQQQQQQQQQQPQIQLAIFRILHSAYELENAQFELKISTQ